MWVRPRVGEKKKKYKKLLGGHRKGVRCYPKRKISPFGNALVLLVVAGGRRSRVL